MAITKQDALRYVGKFVCIDLGLGQSYLGTVESVDDDKLGNTGLLLNRWFPPGMPAAPNENCHPSFNLLNIVSITEVDPKTLSGVTTSGFDFKPLLTAGLIVSGVYLAIMALKPK